LIAFFILSLLFAAGSYGVSWWAKRQARKAKAVDAAPEIPLAQLAEDAASVAQELGAGSFRQEVKIHGRVVCDAPLTAELSHTACVSYRFSVTREFEESLWDRDNEGNTIQRRVRRNEVVASNEVSTPFWLDDGTSRILVHADQAKVERIKTHASFQPAALQGTQVGSFILSWPSPPGGTIGYRYEEHSLPVGQEVTIVAEAGDQGGQLALRKPEAQDAPFLVTTRTVQELARGNRTTLALLQGVSIGLAAVAVLIFILGVLR
jgi:cbb3-type cytochrome oxidase subunit 3